MDDSGITNLKTFIGKEIITLDSAFYRQEFFRIEVENLIKMGIRDSEGSLDKKRADKIIKQELAELIVHATHSENVVEMPDGGEVLAWSERCPHEIWRLQDRVLCLQSHPEFNRHLIENMIVHKMYSEEGKLDDLQRNEVMEKLSNPDLYLQRNILNKLVFNFIFI